MQKSTAATAIDAAALGFATTSAYAQKLLVNPSATTVIAAAAVAP